MDEIKQKLKYLWGRILYAVGKLEKAKKNFESIDDGSSLKVKQFLVQINRLLGNLEVALDYLEEADQLVGDEEMHKRVMEGKVDTLVRMEEYQRALDILGEENQDDVNILSMTAAVGSFMDDQELACEYAKKVLARDPENMQAHFILGGAFYQQDECSEAIEHYEHILEQKDSSKLALDGITACYLELDNLDKAEEYLAKLEQEHEQQLATLFNRARFEYKSGRVKKAYDLLKDLRTHIEEAEIEADVFEELFDKVKTEVEE